MEKILNWQFMGVKYQVMKNKEGWVHHLQFRITFMVIATIWIIIVMRASILIIKILIKIYWIMHKKLLAQIQTKYHHKQINNKINRILDNK